MMERGVVFLAAGLCLFACGCGGTLVPVGGKVSFDGKPVTGGSLAFVPLSKGPDGKPLKPSSGAVQPGGDYRVSTRVANDGANIGKYRVTYSPPATEYPAGVYSPGKPPPPSGFEGLVPSSSEVEVKAGGGQIDIELVKPGK